MKNIIKIFVISCFLYCTQSFATERSLLDYMKIDASKELSVNTHLNQLFRISFGIELDVREQLANSIHRINENEIGKGLLERLVFLIETMKKLQVGNYDGVIYITFKEGEGTYFTGRGYSAEVTKSIGKNTISIPGRNTSVFLNLDFNNKSIIFNPQYGLGSLIPAIKPTQYHSDFCEIGHCFDPFWITIAHELIHMEHFLMEELNKYIKNYIYRSVKYFATSENLNSVKERIRSLSEFRGFEIDIFEKLPIIESISIETLQEYYKFLNDPLRFHARYSANKEMSAWENLSHLISYFPSFFPELNARVTRKKSLSFFVNLEERETVIGARCSELMLRIAEEKRGNILPIRYLYQDMDTFFLEKISVILEIINRARINLGMPGLTQEHLINKLSHKDSLPFFNLGLFSHIIAEELMPDSLYFLAPHQKSLTSSSLFAPHTSASFSSQTATCTSSWSQLLPPPKDDGSDIIQTEQQSSIEIAQREFAAAVETTVTIHLPSLLSRTTPLPNDGNSFIIHDTDTELRTPAQLYTIDSKRFVRLPIPTCGHMCGLFSLGLPPEGSDLKEMESYQELIRGNLNSDSKVWDELAVLYKSNISIFKINYPDTLTIANTHNISSLSPIINILYENAHYTALIPITDIDKIRQFMRENYALQQEGWFARF